MEGGWFSGFPQETFAFLAELAKHNNKPWFDKNRDYYREYVEAPADAFIFTMEREMGARFSGVGRMHGKMFRIYRDIRFSKDKTPYKTHIGIRFGEGIGSKCSGPVFYAHIEAEGLSLVTGVKEFEGNSLSRFRRAAAEDKTGGRLEKILNGLKRSGLEERGGRYKTGPSGFPPKHPRERLLRAKGLYVESRSALPDEIHGGGFARHCFDHFGKTKPLYDWLKSNG